MERGDLDHTQHSVHSDNDGLRGRRRLITILKESSPSSTSFAPCLRLADAASPVGGVGLVSYDACRHSAPRREAEPEAEEAVPEWKCERVAERDADGPASDQVRRCDGEWPSLPV